MSRRYVSDSVIEFVESCFFARTLLSDYAEWDAFSPALEAELEYCADLEEDDFNEMNVQRVDAAISEAEAIAEAMDENIWAIEHVPTDRDGVVSLHRDLYM